MCIKRKKEKVNVDFYGNQSSKVVEWKNVIVNRRKGSFYFIKKREKI